MLSWDNNGNIQYKNPYASWENKSLNAKDFTNAKSTAPVGPVKKNTPSQSNTNPPVNPPQTPKSDTFDLGTWFKNHANKFSESPWKWAADNPWLVAGGIGALSGGASGAGEKGFNVGRGITHGLLTTGLIYALIKGGQHFGRFTNDIMKKVDDRLNHYDQRTNRVYDQVENTIKSVGDTVQNMRDEMSNVSKAGQEVANSIRKTSDNANKGIQDLRGLLPQNSIKKLIEDDANTVVNKKPWQPVKNEKGEITHYEPTSGWDRFKLKLGKWLS